MLILSHFSRLREVERAVQYSFAEPACHTSHACVRLKVLMRTAPTKAQGRTSHVYVRLKEWKEAFWVIFQAACPTIRGVEITTVSLLYFSRLREVADKSFVLFAKTLDFYDFMY